MTNSINIPMPVQVESSGSNSVQPKSKGDINSSNNEFNDILSNAIDNSKEIVTKEVEGEVSTKTENNSDENIEQIPVQFVNQDHQDSQTTESGLINNVEFSLTSSDLQLDTDSSIKVETAGVMPAPENTLEKAVPNLYPTINPVQGIEAGKTENQIQSFVDGFQPTKGVYNPMTVVNRQPGNSDNEIKIVNPIAAREISMAQPGAPVEIEANARDGIWQALYDANSPPVRSNAPPGEFAQTEVAGPRGNDLSMQYRSNRFTEEANPDKTQRVVSETPINSYSWMKSLHFRRPVSEISKNSFIDSMHSNRPEVATVKTEQQSVAKAVELNSPELIRTAPSQEFTSSSQLESRDPGPQIPQDLSNSNRIESTTSPKETAKTPEIQPSELKETVKPQEQEIKTDKGVKFESNSTEAPVFSRPTAQPAVSQDKPTSNPASTPLHDSKEMVDFDIKVVSQSVTSSPTQSLPIDPGQVATGNVSLDSSAQAVSIQPDIQSIKVEEPVHILANAPGRIAGEIKMVETEIIPDGGKAILKVELNPPRLGPMEIELSKMDSGMEVKLVVRTIFARELLNHRGDEIRTALQEQGIDVKKFEIVDLNQQRQDQNQQFSGFNPGETPFGKHQGESSQDSSKMNPDGDDVETIAGVEDTGNEDTISSESALNVLA